MLTTINFLECITAGVGLQVDLEEGTLLQLSCILTMTGSTTARGWLHCSNFPEKDKTDVQV